MTSATDIRAGGAYIELYTKSKLKEQLAAEKAAAAKWAKDVQNVTSLGLNLTAVGTAITAPLLFATKAFADHGSMIDDISQRTGASVEAIAGLQYAAELSGTGIEDLTAGFRKMAQTVDGALTGQKTAVELLQRLGLTVDAVRGKKPEELFSLFADSIAGISDPVQRAAVAMELFGKSGGNLIPLLSNGSAGIAQLRKEAEQLGLVMSGEDVKAAHEFGDSLGRTWAAVRGLTVTIGSALAPALKAGADLFVAVNAPIRDFLKNNKALVTGLALAGVAILGTGLALTALGVSITFIGTATAGLASAAAILGAIAVSPVTWLIAAGAAVVGVLGYVTGAFSAVQSLFGTVSDGVSSTIQGIANAIRAGKIEVAWEIVGAAMQIGWITTVNYLKDTWREFALFVGEALKSPLKTVTAELAAFARELRDLTGVDVGVKSLADLDRSVSGTDSQARRDADAARQADQQRLTEAQAQFKALVESVAPPEALKSVRDIPGVTDLAAAKEQRQDNLRDNVSGTFSGRAAVGIAGSATAKIEKATAETAKNTKLIANKPGLVFGP